MELEAPNGELGTTLIHCKTKPTLVQTTNRVQTKYNTWSVGYSLRPQLCKGESPKEMSSSSHQAVLLAG